MPTTIQISRGTLQRLKELEIEKLKEGKTGKISYDDIINELIDSHKNNGN